MALWDFKQTAGVLSSLGIADAAGEPLDIAAVAAERGEDVRVVGEIVGVLRAQGLVFLSPEEPDQSPILTRSGSQYLTSNGRVDPAVLRFLPEYVDDLNARSALIDTGRALVDEFRAATLAGRLVDHARGIAPPAFAEAIDQRIALDLFAAAVALIARLSCAASAACVAEEIVAVSLLEDSARWFEVELEQGRIAAEDVAPGIDALHGVFSLLRDDDVLLLFEMAEPGDAALAGHSRVNLTTGVADQRIEAWFRPFGGVTPTGYLARCLPPEG